MFPAVKNIFPSGFTPWHCISGLWLTQSCPTAGTWIQSLFFNLTSPTQLQVTIKPRPEKGDCEIRCPVERSWANTAADGTLTHLPSAEQPARPPLREERPRPWSSHITPSSAEPWTLPGPSPYPKLPSKLPSPQTARIQSLGFLFQFHNWKFLGNFPLHMCTCAHACNTHTHTQPQNASKSQERNLHFLEKKTD